MYADITFSEKGPVDIKFTLWTKHQCLMFNFKIKIGHQVLNTKLKTNFYGHLIWPSFGLRPSLSTQMHQMVKFKFYSVKYIFITINPRSTLPGSG